MMDILVPPEQEGTKAIVRSWLKKVGDVVRENDPLVELETDKVTQEVPSPAAGILREIVLDTDAEAVPGAILGRMALNVGDAASSAEALPVVTATNAAPVADYSHNQTLSPAVRKAIAKHGIDISGLSGSGRNGRITRADIDQAIAAGTTVPAAVAPPASQPAMPTLAPMADSASGGSRCIPHDRMRLSIAQNMLNSVTVAPHVTAVFEADFSAIMAHRRKHKAAFENDGINLTFTAYIIAACVEAMRAAPAINSRWHEDRLEIFDDMNIGVGTALGDKGLVVPVVAKAQDLSLRGIAARLGDLTGRARENKLTPADMRSGTFTISNHGVSGSLFASPIIIAQPQSAILGVGKLEKRVVVKEIDDVDTIQIRPMCYVSLTIDHRVVDGHQTNMWLSRLVEVLEGWSIDG